MELIRGHLILVLKKTTKWETEQRGGSFEREIQSEREQTFTVEVFELQKCKMSHLCYSLFYFSFGVACSAFKYCYVNLATKKKYCYVNNVLNWELDIFNFNVLGLCWFQFLSCKFGHLFLYLIVIPSQESEPALNTVRQHHQPLKPNTLWPRSHDTLKC